MTKRQRFIGLLALGFAGLGAVGVLLQHHAAPRPTKFPLKILASAKLLDSFHHVGGIGEHTYAFAFEVDDDELLDQETLVAMLVRHEWSDKTRQFYRTVYRDTEAGRLYVEYGNW